MNELECFAIVEFIIVIFVHAQHKTLLTNTTKQIPQQPWTGSNIFIGQMQLQSPLLSCFVVYHIIFVGIVFNIEAIASSREFSQDTGSESNDFALGTGRSQGAGSSGTSGRRKRTICYTTCIGSQGAFFFLGQTTIVIIIRAMVVVGGQSRRRRTFFQHDPSGHDCCDCQYVLVHQ